MVCDKVACNEDVPMKIVFAIIAALLLMSSASASAATVTYNNATYAVSTVTGRYGDNVATLQSQVWWGDSAAALSFALLVGNQLGTPNNPATSPLFMSGTFSNKAIGYAYVIRNGHSGVTQTSYNLSSRNVTYAVATLTPVPIPAAGLVLISALAGVKLLGRRSRKVPA